MGFAEKHKKGGAIADPFFRFSARFMNRHSFRFRLDAPTNPNLHFDSASWFALFLRFYMNVFWQTFHRIAVFFPSISVRFFVATLSSMKYRTDRLEQTGCAR